MPPIPKGQIKLIRPSTQRALEATLDLKSNQQLLAGPPYCIRTIDGDWMCAQARYSKKLHKKECNKLYMTQTTERAISPNGKYFMQHRDRESV